MPPIRPRLGRLTAALVLPALLLGSVASPVAAARPRATGPADASGLTINAFIRECVVYGDGVPDGTSVSAVTMKRANGTKVAVDTFADASGSWQMSTVCDNKGKGAILPGDTIQVFLSDATSRTFTVPDVVPYGDPSTGKLGGKAPAGGTLVVKLATCDGNEPGDCGTYVLSEHPSFVNANGAWSWTAFEYPVGDLMRTWLTGLDLITVDFSPNANEFYRATSYDANYLARVGSPVVTGYGRIGRKVSVTLKTAKGAVRATGSTTIKGYRGAWSVTLRKNGKKVAPRVGDVVTATNVAKGTLKLRKLGLTVDPDMPTLIGQCWPSRLWWVARSSVASSAAWTETDGSFRLNFVTLPDAGTELTIRCASVPGAIQTGTWTMPAS